MPPRRFHRAVCAAGAGMGFPHFPSSVDQCVGITTVSYIRECYGLVYPGVGWAIWRHKDALPCDLVFDVNYLGGSMPTFALKFSRPSSEVMARTTCSSRW